MGGENFQPPICSTDEISSPGRDCCRDSMVSGFYRGEDNPSINQMNGQGAENFDESSDYGCGTSSATMVAERRREKRYSDVLSSYRDLNGRIERLQEARTKILSYTPGSFFDDISHKKLRANDIPKVTSLLLIGPKGSGKSSLINRIINVFEDGVFASERAQVFYNSANGQGTYFLQEFMIPRGSGSFCLYDTRSLSGDSAENADMLNGWMTKGVSHGELVQRVSDALNLKARLNLMARSGYTSPTREINFVIFVVDGTSILESIISDDETKKRHTDLVSTVFNNPMLSFKDDKPAVVIRNGDLLPLSDRARIRVHLAELLDIPAKQIFDIPESDDPLTTLTIFEMLHYCLEHADRNLPCKVQKRIKLRVAVFIVFLFLLVVKCIAIFVMVLGSEDTLAPEAADSSGMKVEWSKIRHLWLDQV